MKKSRKKEKQKAAEAPVPPLLAKNNDHLLVSVCDNLFPFLSLSLSPSLSLSLFLR